jgi:2-polyprenyl-3-methyl-5-hydroxy-6-metoxy-1,4-benzoquinol methylase
VKATEFLQRTCPVCGGNNAPLLLRKGDLQLVRCGACGMIFANPVPAEFETGDFYDHSGQYYLSPEKLAGDFDAVRFARELRLFRRHCPRGRVLDVGCSTGAFLFQLQNQFPGQYEILGTDVAGPALDHAQSKGVPVLRGNFLEQSFDAPFDAITFWAVVEHLVHPRPFLQKASTILKPGGLCFVLVPNFNSLATRLLGAHYRYILPQHVNYFTASTLRKLCEKDFVICKTTSTHFNPLVIAKDFFSREGTRESERAGLLKRTTAMKKNPLLAPLRLAYSAAELVLSQLMLADNIAMVLRRR